MLAAACLTTHEMTFQEREDVQTLVTVVYSQNEREFMALFSRRSFTARCTLRCLLKAPMIKIGIVDDHAVVRAGLREFFSQHVDLRVVGEACNGREAIDLARTKDLDVLTMDVSMPGQSGLEALAMIRAKAPDIGILMLSGYPEVQYAVSLIRQGAAGYLNKDCDPMEIVNAVRTIALGRRYITPGVADLLARQLHRTVGVPAHESLSQRELQVLLRLAKGETVGDISKALVLSGKTVSTYRTRMMEKMGLTSNSELTYYALKCRLIE